MDLVITWVDGEDPRHKLKRAAYGGPVASDLYAGQRLFRNKNELKYLLRSVEKFAPWIEQIYLIVDQQWPDWLKADSPRLKRIEHSEIFPLKEDLPNFNSAAIESCMHRIPGLSEHFLYANDDTFFGRPLSKDLICKDQKLAFCRDSGFRFFRRRGFLDDLLSFFHFSFSSSCYFPVWAANFAQTYFGCRTAAELNFRLMCWYTRNLLRFKFGVRKPERRTHQITAFCKSKLIELESSLPVEYALLRKQKFRSRLSFICVFLAPALEMARGERFLDSTSKNIFLNDWESLCSISSDLQKIQDQEFDFVCINDSGHTDWLPEFLENWLPEPSSFEILKLDHNSL
ncbi:MAG: Stealth CR1 domain-containing protein [Candidatus Obscuribacterales bacterium]|nr:Stealth CR1 domain-containing protein [Candidatus Obscuribacterales bacterium]